MTTKQADKHIALGVTTTYVSKKYGETMDLKLIHRNSGSRNVEAEYITSAGETSVGCFDSSDLELYKPGM